MLYEGLQHISYNMLIIIDIFLAIYLLIFLVSLLKDKHHIYNKAIFYTGNPT